MLILQLILSAIAWFRGWKWYALIPFTVGIIITLLIKYILINPSNAMTMKLVASISTVVINLVLLMFCIFKKPTKSHKGDDSSGVMEDIVRNDEMKQAEPEHGTGGTVDKEVNEEPTNNNVKESIGYVAPVQVIGTKQFYYSRGRKKKGPYTKDELVKLKLKPETLIWTEGLDKWQPLSDFDGLIKTPPPLPNEVQPNKIKPRKRIAVSLVLLVLLLGISIIATYYFIEGQKNDYLNDLIYEIDKIFNGNIVLCGGEEYLTKGELVAIDEELRSSEKSDNINFATTEVLINDEIIKAVALERFYSQGISFKLDKLSKHGSDYWLESYTSKDLVFFAKSTIEDGVNGRRRAVTPEEAYENCYKWITNENSSCFDNDFYDKLSYFKAISNKYYYIASNSEGEYVDSRGNDYYRVYYSVEATNYRVLEYSWAIKEDFWRNLAMFGGISIILVIFLYLVNPFR